MAAAAAVVVVVVVVVVAREKKEIKHPKTQMLLLLHLLLQLHQRAIIRSIARAGLKITSPFSLPLLNPPLNHQSSIFSTLSYLPLNHQSSIFSTLSHLPLKSTSQINPFTPPLKKRFVLYSNESDRPCVLNNRPSVLYDLPYVPLYARLYVCEYTDRICWIP